MRRIPRGYYLVCVIDACTRLAWAEVVTDLKSLTVMFSALKSFNLVRASATELQFAEVLTDNGSEFAAPTQPATHPFERMLLELGDQASVYPALPAADQRQGGTVLADLER